MKFTEDQMKKFFVIYFNQDDNNLNNFVKELANYGVNEEESTLIWQSFDIADLYYCMYLKS